MTSTNKRIVFIGKTGTGKSSLINKIVGQDILPVDPFSCGTASIIEVSRTDDLGFSIQVCFCSKEELTSVFRNALERNVETELAREFIKAHDNEMHPDVPRRLHDLSKVGFLPKHYQDLVGNQIVQSSTNLEEIKRSLHKYSDYSFSMRQVIAYWPIVSVIRVTGPFTGIPFGVTLIDTPPSNFLFLGKITSASRDKVVVMTKANEECKPHTIARLMMKYKDPIFVFNRFEAFDSLREARELPDHEDLDNLINKVILDFYPKEANIHVSELKPIYNKDKYQFLHQQLVQSILHNKKAVRFTKETKVVDGKGIRKSKRLPSVVVVRRSKRKLVH